MATTVGEGSLRGRQHQLQRLKCLAWIFLALLYNANTYENGSTRRNLHRRWLLRSTGAVEYGRVAQRVGHTRKGIKGQESEIRGQGSATKTFPDPRPPTSDLYDIVLALEIIEHVADIPGFVQMASRLIKPGGLIIFSTINRTPKSYALAIIGAEYILRWLPRGTHDWKKFVRPSELCRHLRDEKLLIASMTGMVLNPLTFEWQLNPRDLAVNYLITANKPI